MIDDELPNTPVRMPEPEQIAAIPRISMQAFCETPDLAAVVSDAAGDRRMDKAHVKVHMGGAPAAIEAYRTAPTPNLIVLEVGPDQSVWKTRLGMGVISSTIQVTLTVVERLGNQTKYLAVTSGGGGTGRSEILLSFDEHENGTHVTYQADILERTGLLKIVSISLIRSAAQTVIEETWQSINARLK